MLQYMLSPDADVNTSTDIPAINQYHDNHGFNVNGNSRGIYDHAAMPRQKAQKIMFDATVGNLVDNVQGCRQQ